MRILHVIPRWIGGGPERHLVELARHDRDRPIDVQRRVLVLDRPLSAPLLVAARRVGLTVVPDAWEHVVDREVAAADLVDVTYWNHPALLALLRRPLPAARVVVRSAVAGDTLPQIIPPELVPFPDAWILSAPPGHGARHVAAGHRHVVHVPSLADMARLDGYAPRAHPGVRAVHVGNLTATKLHPDVARIVALVTHPDVTVALHGDADERSVARLGRQLRAHGVADRVELHGHVEDIADVLATADLSVHPLRADGYATSEKTLQEAMWVGLPPVVIEGTAAAGWVEHEVSGLVAADVPTFAAHVDRLAGDEVLRRRIGDAARAAARVRFDPRRNAAALWDVVERRMGEAKRTRAVLPGAGGSASERFLAALGRADGGMAGEFLRRVSGPDVRADALLLRGEGGVLHHRNVAAASGEEPDGRLDAWAEVLLAAEEREERGEREEREERGERGDPVAEEARSGDRARSPGVPHDGEAAGPPERT